MSRRTDLPMVVPDPALPSSVTIYEVGPRDGLQNESAVVPLDAKVEFIERLVATGLPVVEATSFVHPKWVPQLADAADLLERLGPHKLGKSCVYISRLEKVDLGVLTELAERAVSRGGDAASTS